MLAIRQILVALSPFEANYIAIDRAMQLTMNTGATCEIVIYRQYSELTALKNLDHRWQQEVQKNLEAESLCKVDHYLNQYPLEGADFKVKVEWCRCISKAILQRVENNDYDLIIRSPDDSHLGTPFITTATDWQIIQACCCPIWMTHPKSDKNTSIIASLDLNLDLANQHDSNSAVLNYASQYAQLLDIQLHALHAFPQLPQDVNKQFVRIFENEYSAESKLLYRNALEQTLNQYNIPPQRRHLVKGPPEQAIANYLKAKPNGLLVLSTSNTERSHNAFGSAAEKILSQIKCDKLIVKSNIE